MNRRIKRIGATGNIGQWLSWPQTGNVITYDSPSATANVVRVFTGTTGNNGSIGQVIAMVQDSGGGNWYQIDTTNGATPLYPATVYVPAFGDTTQSNVLNLTPAQASAVSPLSFSATNTNGGGSFGLGFLNRAGIGPFTTGESILLGLFIIVGTGITINATSK